MGDALWYKDAIIYEVPVRAFCDSDGDGIGDFKGLTSKLDYLQDLGVTAIWLLPFYPSPLRDDGYDIADYTDIHPTYGTLRDFKTFLREARWRGLKVITELVLNTPPTSTPGSSGHAGPVRAASTGTSTSGATRRTATGTPASSSRTSRRRTGPGTRWRTPTTGTASTPTSPT